MPAIRVVNAYQVPCAMVQLVARYPALDDRREASVFLWYLADAPAKALEPLLPVSLMPKMLGTVALDIAVTHSFNENLAGRTGLHAAPEGGDTLTEWYSSRGMANLPKSANRPSMFRANDGRYFYYTPSAATAASQVLDNFRQPGA